MSQSTREAVTDSACLTGNAAACDGSFYIDLAELPGPIVETEDALTDAIVSFDTENFYDDRYRAFNAKYNYLDDGHAAQRVVEHVFAPIGK